MREHPLIPTIRKAMWCLLALSLAPWTFEGSFAAFTAGFGWWPGCGCCGSGISCSRCDPDYSGDFQVDIAGIADGLDCTNCTCLNDSYVLDLDSDSFFSGYCEWIKTGGITGCTTCSAPDCSTTVDHTLVVRVIGGGAPEVQVIMSTIASAASPGWGEIIWSNTSYMADVNCGALSSENIPFLSDAASSCTGVAVANACDASGSTCDVTAV